MPVQRICTKGGCFQIQTNGTRCNAHQKIERSDDKFEQFYQTRGWRDLSKMFKDRNPLCIRCTEEGKTTYAAVADHIIELREDWDRRLDWNNLDPLCHKHHNKKTKRRKEARAV